MAKPSASTRAEIVAATPAGRIRFQGALARNREGGSALLLFKGGLPHPVMEVRLLPDSQALVRFPLERKSWRGSRAAAPPPLVPFLELAALYAKENTLREGEGQERGARHRAAFLVHQGRLREAVVAEQNGHSLLARVHSHP